MSGKGNSRSVTEQVDRQFVLQLVGGGEGWGPVLAAVHDPSIHAPIAKSRSTAVWAWAHVDFEAYWHRHCYSCA